MDYKSDYQRLLRYKCATFALHFAKMDYIN
jgi:hypothetical protein